LDHSPEYLHYILCTSIFFGCNLNVSLCGHVTYGVQYVYDLHPYQITHAQLQCSSSTTYHTEITRSFAHWRCWHDLHPFKTSDNYMYHTTVNSKKSRIFSQSTFMYFMLLRTAIISLYNINYWFLGAIAIVRKATIGFVMSLCPPVRMEKNWAPTDGFS